MSGVQAGLCPVCSAGVGRSGVCSVCVPPGPSGDVVVRARAALEGVTEGPWVQVGFGNVQRVPAGDYPPVAKAWRSANAEFIAAARSLVPELVAEVERLRASWPGRVWVALGTDDDGSDSGYRYVSAVFDTEERAARYQRDGWGITIEQVEVQ